MNRTFILKDPAESTKKRMWEVQFYLNMLELTGGTVNDYYVDNIVENIMLKAGAKVSVLNVAYSELSGRVNRPSPLELIMANHYLDIPVRSITAVTHTANRTLYNALETYIKNGDYDLHPKLDENTLLEIKKFNESIRYIFPHISKLASKGVCYD